MKTLQDAWKWYQDARSSLRLLCRFGSKHWEILSKVPTNEQIIQDDAFRMLTGQDIVEPAQYALDQLEDLAVVVMFSVFEAIVRESLINQIMPEVAELKHQTLKSSATDTVDTIRFGSFYHILKPFRELQPGLTEEVDQVREYRNWVAHGKRQVARNMVTPDTTYRRLLRFLDEFSLHPEVEI